MYDQSARYYDAIYAQKNYAAETAKLRALIAAHRQDPARTLLDVACGSGRHLAELRPWFDIEGVDVSAGLLELARDRLPGVKFHQADMRSFRLDTRYDVVTCLFSAIGYMTTPQDLDAAIANMARHVAPGGLLIIEPWWPPDNWILDGEPRAQFADGPDYKIARMSISAREGDIAILDFHFLVGSREGFTYFREEHRLGLFTADQHLAAFRDAGLEVAHDAAGLIGRGAYIGRRPHNGQPQA
jgi:SAM-dependent methyltransferase